MKSARWLVVVTCLVSLVQAQDPVPAGPPAEPAKPRPKIGLALGGGGARGFAHVGVLEWFEQHHIPIDYIAGTSMGGLVGALYASGMSTQDMRTSLAGTNWDELFRDTPPYYQLSFRRKEDQRFTPNALEVGLRHGFSLPGGVIEGQKIGFLLTRLTLPVADIDNFDNLPIPFRCVATDMTAAVPVVLSHGSLAQAMRATMAVPGVFSPVEIDGKILADGGLLNNVPTDVVKAMGADIVIAVDIGTPLGDKRSVETLVGMINQSIGVMMAQNVRKNLRLADVILSPDLDVYGSADFKAAEQIAARGYQGAQARAGVLANLSVDDATWQQYLLRSRRKPQAQVITPTFLEVRGNERIPTSVIERRVGDQLNRPLNPNRLEAELTRIYGEGYYSRLNYQPIRRQGQRGLVINVRERTYGPPFLRLQVSLDGGTHDETDFSLRGRLTTHGLTGYGSEWRSDLQLGRDNLIGTEYYQPIGTTPWFSSARGWYRIWRNDLFVGNLRAADYQSHEAGMGGDVGYLFSTSSRLQGGLAFGQINQSVSVGAPVRPNVHQLFGFTHLQFTNDRRDSAILPTRGMRIDTELRYYLHALGSDAEFPWMSGEFQYWQPLDPHATNLMFVSASGGTTFNSTAPPYGEFLLGGLGRLSAYRRDQFRGSNAMRGTVGYLHRLTELPFLVGGRVYFGGMYELGGAFERINHARYYSSATAGLFAETLFGPAFVGYSFGEGGANQLQFSVGRLF